MIGKNHPSLLPNGLSDLLYPHADEENAIIESCLKEFAKFGYLRVKPPLVEFEQSLLGEGPGKALAPQTFRMMDPVSGRMLGVRADVTAQIARISSSRLVESSRPLRLSYAADVLRVNGTQLRPERQFCQVGCEMIGDDSVFSDVETQLIALLALSSCGIKEITVDVTVPTILRHLYQEMEEDEEQQEILNDLISKRDREAISNAHVKSSSAIVSLMDICGNISDTSKKMSTLSLPKLAMKDIHRLLDVANELKKALAVYGLSDVQITVDPLEHRGLEYHAGVSFSIFAAGARAEIGGGGRYLITGQNKSNETATGFTLYMDSILSVSPKLKEAQRKTVFENARWEEVKELQDQGFLVVRSPNR